MVAVTVNEITSRHSNSAAYFRSRRTTKVRILHDPEMSTLKGLHVKTLVDVETGQCLFGDSLYGPATA